MLATPNAIDPTKIPEKMTRPQLEWWILFGIAVAGKNAKVTEQKMKYFVGKVFTPFYAVKIMLQSGQLLMLLKRAKLGKYKLLDKAYRAAVKLDLDKLEEAEPNAALSMLEEIPGIGPKTARMILMYAFPHHAGLWVPLDTHILHWLRDQGYDAPKSTPTGATYERLELLFLAEALERGLTSRELDTKIWMEYSGNNGETQ